MKHVVLYAEDERADMLLCERAFKSLGDRIHLHFVCDGRSMIDWLDGNGTYGNRAFYPTPQVVIIDSKFTDMSGLEVLRWIRNHRHWKDLPVVLHFGSIPPSRLQDYYDLGVNTCIEKDSAFRNLVDAVRSLLAGEPVPEPAGYR
jgi:CheY-like chemotaxis protein